MTDSKTRIAKMMAEVHETPSAKNLENVGIERWKNTIHTEGTPITVEMLNRVAQKIKDSTEQVEEFCGLQPLVTGKRDPWYKRGTCKKHDRTLQKLKDGHPDKTNLDTFGDFTGDILSGMAEGLYMLVSGPLYWLVGGVGGVLRWSQLERRNAKARGEIYPSNSPED